MCHLESIEGATDELLSTRKNITPYTMTHLTLTVTHYERTETFQINASAIESHVRSNAKHKA